MTLLAKPDILNKVSGRVVVLDTETTGLNWWNDVMIGVGVYCPDAEIEAYIPTLSDTDRREAYSAIASLPTDTTLVNHNIKFDLHFMNLDPTPYREIHDTMVMVHLIDSRYKKSLAESERVFLGADSKRAHVAEAPKRTPIHKWPLETVADYCVNDCRVTYQLAQTLLPLLDRDMLLDLYYKEMEYLKFIWRVERRGITVDPIFINHARLQLQEKQKDLEEELYDSVGYKFNWRSSKQMSKALYEDMGWPRPKNPFVGADGVDRTRFADRGRYNSTLTSTFILMEKAHHPLGELVSTLRETSKLGKTLESWLELMDDEPAIHTNFNLTGTRTGRLSSSKPNVQNIPSFARTRFTQGVYTGGVERTEEYNLRNAFVAREGHTFVSIDYRQMEMRMFGILSGDPFMLKSLSAGRDVHADIAQEVWGTRDKVHREWAKTVSFGLIYAMTTGALQMRLNMTAARAREITEQYWSTFPRIRPWLRDTMEECKKVGYLRYWSGRIWREEAEIDMYKGANAIIQGGCADVLSIAGMRVDRFLRGENLGSIVSLVHDELILEVPTEELAYVIPKARELMSVPDLFNIPWLTDAKVGRTFGDMEAWDEDTHGY